MTPTKRIFVVHSKGDAAHRTLTESLLKLLDTVWAYEDWDWESLQFDGRNEYRSRGTRIDPLRLVQGHAKPFVHRARSHQVDKDTLQSMLKSAFVIVLCEPRTSRVSAGVRVETEILARLLDRPRLFDFGIPMILRISWAGATADYFEALPVRFHVELPRTDGAVREEAVTRVASLICLAMLVHVLHGTAGLYLAAALAEKNPFIHRLVEDNPNFPKVDFSALAEENDRVARELEQTRKATGNFRAAESARIDLAMREVNLEHGTSNWEADVARAKRLMEKLPQPTRWERIGQALGYSRSRREEILDAIELVISYANNHLREAQHRFYFSKR